MCSAAATNRSRSRRKPWCMTYMPVWSCGPSAVWLCPGRVSCSGQVVGSVVTTVVLWLMAGSFVLVGPPCRSSLESGWSATWVRTSRSATTVPFVWVRVLGTQPGGARGRPDGHRRARRAQAPVRAGRPVAPARRRGVPRRAGRPRVGRGPAPRGARDAALLPLRRTTRARARPRAAPETDRAADQRPRLPARPAAPAGGRPPLRRRGQRQPACTGAAREPVHDRPHGRLAGPGHDLRPRRPARGAARALERRGVRRPARPSRRGRWSGPRSTSCVAAPRRTACSDCSRSATTRSSSPPPSRRRPATRCRNGSGRCTRSPSRGRAGRRSRWRRCDTIRRLLADELGLDPGQELRDLEQAVLGQAPVLQEWLRRRARRAPRSPSSVDRHRDPLGHRRPGPGGGRPRGGARPGRDPAKPAFALLVGEPGIGKSRLVEGMAEAAARSRLRGRDRSVRPGRRRPAAVAVEPGARRPRTARRARPRRGAGAPAGGDPG